jgi:hypothetical protein
VDPVDNTLSAIGINLNSAFGSLKASITELLAYVGSYFNMVSASGGNSSGVAVTTPLGSDPSTTQTFIKDVAQAFSNWLTSDQMAQLQNGTMTLDTFQGIIQNIIQADYADDPNFFDKLKNAETHNGGNPHVTSALPAWMSAQERALTADAFVQFIQGLQRSGLDNDLLTIANGLELAGLIQNWDHNPDHIDKLLQDAQFVTALQNLIVYFQQHNAKNGFAAASAVAASAAQSLTGGAAGAGGAAGYIGAISSVLGDISQMFSGSSGTGTLTKDLQYFQDIVGTAKAVTSLVGGSATSLNALGEIAYGAGDVAAIIQGFQTGGVLGGIESGYSADALAEILGAASSIALPIGIAIGLAALFFGGNHDNPKDMPDKYDTQNYGQGVANLEGYAGASGINFTENRNLTNLFAGRTGIQMVEETLAYYDSEANAPSWLQPMYNTLESEFGKDSTGSGRLSIGIGGTGKDDNNQQIVGVAGTSGQEYQYTQLDASLYEFETAYAKARASGQAIAFSWESAASPGSPPPSDTYASTSYQSEYQYYDA